MKPLVLIIVLLNVLSSQAQYKVSTLDLGKEVTALIGSSDGRLIYGAADGSVGYYDGLKPTVAHKLPSKVNYLNLDEALLCGSETGLYSFGFSQGNLTGNHLAVLTTMGDADHVVCRQGIYEKEGSKYREADIDGLPKFNSVSKGDFTSIGESSYLLVNSELYRKDKWWKQYQDSIIDVGYNERELIYIKADGIYSETGEVLTYTSCDSTAKVFLTSEGRIFLTNDNFISELKEGTLRPIYTINTSTVRCITEDQWHNIWLAANQYLYRIALVEYPSLPVLSVISVNDEQPTAKVSLSANSQDLVVKYKGSQLTKPQLLSFQSRLEGKTDWLPQTNELMVRFEDLEPGTYTYQLRASVDGSSYTYADPIHVQVTDGLFLKILLGLLLLGFGILVTALIGNYRLNKYKEKINTERRRLLDQNKLLSLEQKALQLQMNPHFIFNALNSIKGLIAKGDSKKARESLTAFAHLMRSTLDMSRREVTTIEDEVFYLKQYLDLEKWVMQEKFHFTILVDANTDRSLVLPTMIVQPFVENAVKHAFNGTAGTGRISVDFVRKGNYLTVTTADDGVGIKDAQNSKEHKSVAMSVVRDRLALKFPKATAELVVVTSPANSAGGTIVTLNIPILAG